LEAIRSLIRFVSSSSLGVPLSSLPSTGGTALSDSGIASVIGVSGSHNGSDESDVIESSDSLEKSIPANKSDASQVIS